MLERESVKTGADIYIKNTTKNIFMGLDVTAISHRTGYPDGCSIVHRVIVYVLGLRRCHYKEVFKVRQESL